MDSKIEFIDDSTIIRVVYGADISFEDRVNLVQEICLKNQDLSNDIKVLIDTTATAKIMSEVDQTLFVNYITSRVELEKALVAVIVKPEQVINQTVIKQASMLGYKVQLFNSEDDALSWLHEIE